MFNAGSEVVASSADAFGAAIKSEMTTLGKLIKDEEAYNKLLGIETNIAAIAENAIAVTPLDLDLTHGPTLERLRHALS
mgnify:CR=1 FL=1